MCSFTSSVWTRTVLKWAGTGLDRAWAGTSGVAQIRSTVTFWVAQTGLWWIERRLYKSKRSRELGRTGAAGGGCTRRMNVFKAVVKLSVLWRVVIVLRSQCGKPGLTERKWLEASSPSWEPWSSSSSISMSLSSSELEGQIPCSCWLK